MSDREFLEWVRDRLVHVYGESPNVDFVQRLGKIAGQAQASKPIAAVHGWFHGECVIRALDPEAALPAGMALYSQPQAQAVNQQLTLGDLNTIRQWHNAIKDAYVNYLEEQDAAVFAKIEAAIAAAQEQSK